MNRKKTAVKKTTKKAVKKKHPATKKTVPKLQRKRKTLEEVVAVMAETMAENHAKTEAMIAKSREETEKVFQKSREETDKALQKLTADIRQMSKSVGHVGQDIGELMEFIVIPKIRLAMNAAGKHIFNTMQTEKKLKKIDALGEKKTLTEVDVLLYGDTEVMAVETKSHLVTRDVKDHIDRLEVLRQNEDLIDIVDKKLVGAVVGAIVDDGAKDFALNNGLYVVTIREEEDKLNIEKPETCRTW